MVDKSKIDAMDLKMSHSISEKARVSCVQQCTSTDSCGNLPRKFCKDAG